MLSYCILNITAPFNNMRTPKFKSQPTNAFFATVNQIFGGSSQLPTTAELSGNQIIVHSSDNETVLGSSRKLGGPAEHLIDGSEKRICRSTFKFSSPHVIEKCSNRNDRENYVGKK